MLKIAWLQPVWSNYHIARAKAFQKNNPHCELICLSISDVCGEVNSSDWLVRDFLGLKHQVLFTQQKYLDISPFKIAISVIKFILSNKVDALCLLGYARPEVQFIAFVLGIFTKMPALILLSESKKDDAYRQSWREHLKGKLINLYNSALVGGQVHKRYLIQLGMVEESIFLGYDIVENQLFHPDRIKLFPCLIKKPYFLAINRFVTKKNLLFLISSYSKYRQVFGIEAWDLVLCGDGELRPQIEQHIAKLELQDHVHLTGFLQQEEMLPYFAHASCFVHASIQEQWGLVVNEAMAAGLPVLVSSTCGCYEDLIIEGINGFSFDPKNSEQLTELMLKVSSANIDLNKMAQASLEHIQKYSPDYFAQGLMQAIEYALSH
ncbi:MAG: glycosyltransferase [Dolichospermum sp. JUN01]|nr:glycosyltransferase [Dolichospermum sp. JUN01]